MPRYTPYRLAILTAAIAAGTGACHSVEDLKQGIGTAREEVAALPLAVTRPVVGDPIARGAQFGSHPDPEGMCEARTYKDKFNPGYTPDRAIRDQVTHLLSLMSVEDKILQITGTDGGSSTAKNYSDIQRTPDDVTNGIRGYYFRDGPHGVNLESKQEGREDKDNYATSFPVTVSQGASFDMELNYRLGVAMGDETVASRNTMLLGPCMNILRHPFWGRAQETYGEDVFHLGRIASAYTAGLQTFTAGCAKHFAANNIEVNRASLNAEMDEQTLREIYGRHFEMVIEDGGVACIMASYNKVNGTKATQNHHLLTEVLRDDFGFQGFVLTDWWAMPPGQSFPDPTAAQGNAWEALYAGLDMELPWALNYASVADLIATTPEIATLVDRAAGRILEQKLRFEVAYLSDGYGPSNVTPTTSMSEGSIVNNEQHVQLARESAAKGMVLLKNDNQILPIAPTTTKVALLGNVVEYNIGSDNPSQHVIDYVRDSPLGDRGSSRVKADPQKSTGPLQGLTDAGSRNGRAIQIVPGSSAEEVGDADVAVVVVGLTSEDEGEEYTGAGDRDSYSLAPVHNNLIQAVAATGVPTVVVIEAGGVVDLPWLNQVDAVIMAWYPGQAGGAALGDLLFGDTNFSAKLPVTWPKTIDQFPVFNQAETTVMDYYLGYRYFDIFNQTPLFPFGHGLSYTNFELSDLDIPCTDTDVSKDGVIEVGVNVWNDGEGAVDGDAVVMVFASWPDTNARRSVKELKGFQRVSVPAGQGVPVNIPIRVQDLKYWDQGAGEWVVESGAVNLQVGLSSDQLPLSQVVNIRP